MTPRGLVEARHNGPIPAHELDLLRYPTRANQIARAAARLAGANQKILRCMHEWRMDRLYSQWRGVADIDALRRIADIHRPHLRYWRRERRRWADHLTVLEN